MSLFFARLEVGYPGPLTRPIDKPASWKIFRILRSGTFGSCTTLADLKACQSNSDRTNAQKSYSHLLNCAVTGLPLPELYDEKKCHEAFSFKYGQDNKDIKILRIWGTGETRMYFLYLSDRNIVLLKTLAKRAQKLTDGEVKEIQDLATEVLDCVTKSGFNSRIVCKPDQK